MAAKRKEKVEWMPSSTTVFQTTVSGSSTSQSTSVTRSSNQKLDFYRTSKTTTGYLSLSLQGKVLPDNGFTFYQMTRDPSVVVSRSRSKSGSLSVTRVTEYQNVYGTRLEAGTTPIRRSDLVVQILNKAAGNQVNLPVFFAEAGKTTSMVVNTATRLVQMIRHLRRGNIVGFLGQLDIPQESKSYHRRNSKRVIHRFSSEFGRDARSAAANAWLATTYGWTPLLMEVRSAVNTWMDIGELEDGYVGRVRAQMRAEQVFATTVGTDPVIKRVQHVRHSSRMLWRYKMTPTSTFSRLGLTNPATVAWELIPFSFVADWFLPIGDYLSTLDASLRFTHVGGSYGLKSVSDVYENHTHLPGSAREWSGTTKTSTLVVQLNPLTAIPSVSLTDFTVRPELGVKRMISAVALLHQNLSWFKR